jgi:hypothetical protein
LLGRDARNPVLAEEPECEAVRPAAHPECLWRLGEIPFCIQAPNPYAIGPSVAPASDGGRGRSSGELLCEKLLPKPTQVAAAPNWSGAGWPG